MITRLTFSIFPKIPQENNLLEKHVNIAAKLEAELTTWNSSLCAPDPGSPQECAFFHRYLNLPMPGK